jgi:hypothetical protein
MFPDFQAPGISRSPFSYPGEFRQLYTKDLITFECQLAELAWEASWFFSLPVNDLPLPDYDATKEVYTKLLAWNAGRKQRLLLNSDLIPSVIVLDVAFETILLKLLNCFCRSSYLLDGKAASVIRNSFAASIMSNLWVYRAAHGMRHERWLSQVCLLAATAILQNDEENEGMRKSIAIACQLLFDIGKYLPMGKKGLLIIKVLAQRQSISLPTSCKAVFSSLATGTRNVTVKGARLIDPGLPNSYRDGSIRSDSNSYAFSFSSNILGVMDLSAERDSYHEEKSEVDVDVRQG